jgi:hypothetical protein
MAQNMITSKMYQAVVSVVLLVLGVESIVDVLGMLDELDGT